MIADALGAVLLVGGAALVALGGLGLVRFPDVFTRMHAATKAATVGVIGTTGAAALEAGAPAGVFLLLLVIALLFLSGPLGMSLLARAAYRDPETPRMAATQELDIALPRAESTSALRGVGTSWVLAGWLFLVWIALFGAVRWNVVLGGLAVAALVTYALRRLAPRWPRALLRPLALGRFVSLFLRQLVAATWDVVGLLAVGHDELRPAVVEIPVELATRSEIALLMNAVSFTPGTIALELHEDQLYVHVLSRHPADRVVADMMRMQRSISRAFGSVRLRSGNRNHVTRDV